MKIYMVLWYDKYCGEVGVEGLYRKKDKAIDYLKTRKDYTKVTETLYKNQYKDCLEVIEMGLIE